MAIYKSGAPVKYSPITGSGIRLPRLPGEYDIYDGRGKRLYHGETNNLQRRAGEHARNGHMAPGHDGAYMRYKVADGQSTSEMRRQHERMKIAQHKPPLNRSKGGEGRPPAR